MILKSQIIIIIILNLAFEVGDLDSIVKDFMKMYARPTKWINPF